MSNYSSEEELGDSLQIKPPQVRPRGRGDRPHRKDHRENFGESYHSNRHAGFHRKEYEETGYEGSRRKDYGHSSLRRGDDDIGNRPQRHHYDHGLERSHRKRIAHERHDPVERRYKESSRDRQERGQPSSRYRSESPPVRDDRQLQKHKKKRKHAEEEEERAFREIEKRRERERRREEGRITNEESGSSGSRKRAKIDRREKRSPARPSRPQSRDSDLQHSEAEEMLDLTVSDDDVQNLLPRVDTSEHESHSDDEGHGSNASDDREQTKRSKASLRHNEERASNAASDISSESERKESASGSDTSKSKSKGESASEDSESDSSESNHSTNSKETKQKKDSTNGKLEDKNQKQEVGSKSDSEISDGSIEDVPDDDEPIPLEKDSLAEPSSTTEVIPEVIVERELTEVEKACQELDLLEPYYPSIQGCRRVEEFQLMNRIEEGTYGVVYRAKDKRTNEVVALKRLKMEKEKDGFPITSLREINTLLKAQHENIVTVREIVVGSNTDKIFLVMDYVEHDLKALMETLKQKKQEFIMGEIKCLLIQLLRAVAHLHDNWILHRDLKTSNLLLSHKGILKVGDFGLAREYGSPLKAYTPIVVTLWYRAPELLLGAKHYSTPIDVWSVGCIFGELLKMEPMFPGKSEANQLNLIFQTLGTPNDRIWSGYSKMPLLQKMTFGEYPVNKLKTKFGILSDSGIDLMNKFLTYNPDKRITAEEALSHSFFREAPLPIDPSIFPTWPAKSEMGARKHASPKPPSGGRQFKDLKEDDSVGFFLGAGDRRPPVGAGFSLKF